MLQNIYYKIIGLFKLVTPIYVWLMFVNYLFLKKCSTIVKVICIQFDLYLAVLCVDIFGTHSKILLCVPLVWVLTQIVNYHEI